MQINMNILLIYTGGTIGMKQDPHTGALAPFDFSQIVNEVPELGKFGCKIDSITFDPPRDSSDIDPEFWRGLVDMIGENYSNYDGFVILHGTDTMSYTASALSFMLENLEKPVILTGSQLPIGMLRTDGKENLISAIEIASKCDNEGRAIVPEVCIYFQNELFRGNRTTKYNAENFRAFASPNYPLLAETGVHIKYNLNNIRRPEVWGRQLRIYKELNTEVAILKIFPGLSRKVMNAVLSIEGVKAIILETYGSGNAPTKDWFISEIKNCISKGTIIVNVTQCQAGEVDMEAYATGIRLKEAGVISGIDITTEAALAKLFFLLGQSFDINMIKCSLEKNLRGEITTM